MPDDDKSDLGRPAATATVALPTSAAVATRQRAARGAAARHVRCNHSCGWPCPRAPPVLPHPVLEEHVLVVVGESLHHGDVADDGSVVSGGRRHHAVHAGGGGKRRG
jgi:hypothetical protein